MSRNYIPKLISRLTTSLILIILIGFEAYGQAPLAKRNWYFGTNENAVRFARPDFTVTLDSLNMFGPFSRFGNATATNPETGDLIFYTNGQYVFDGNYQLMDGIIPSDNNFLLNADVNKNQNTAIVSTPGNDERYIVFTNTATNAINFSVIDMALPGNAVFPQPNLGTVGPFNQPIATSSSVTSDAMLAIAKADLSGYWLLTADIGTNNYKILDINGSDPSTWTEQPFSLGNPLTAAHFAYSSVSNKIAVAPSSSNTNIHILDFDATAGTLALDTVVLNSGNADQLTEAIYDVEWSPDGTKLYISRYGGVNPDAGDVLQWDSTLPSSSSLVSVLADSVYGSYGLQIGPDNSIYHLYQNFNGGPFLMGSISDADSIPASVIYNPQVLGGQDFQAHQFPALLPPRDTPLTVDFDFAGICANTPTTFYPIIEPAPDSVFWDFGDGMGSSDQLSPFYTYTGASTYNVVLFAALNGQVRQATKPVAITQFDLQLTVPSDTVACSCELPVNGPPTCTPFSVTAQASNEPPGVTYLWSNGDIGLTLTPDSAGYYYVVATDPMSGCTAYAGVNIQEYGVPDQRANVWYFGTNAGIDFNEVPSQAIGDGIMDAPEGCTAISDRNGSVLFYTDGDAIYVKDRIDGTHSQVDIGLGGDPISAQSVVAVPFTDDETLYYIFTTEAVGSGTGNYEFKFSVFDIKLNSGRGGIAEKDITLFSKSTERITANGNWVVIHEYGNNNFRAYPITQTGLGSPIVTSMGSDHSTTAPEYGQGYMKFSSIGNKLAVALAESPTGPNYVEVFEWDNGLGQVTDFRRLDLSADGAIGQVYGVEFSPGDSKLYATVKGAASSMIMEYRADTLDLMHVITPIMSTGGELGAIQTSPDGQLLVAVKDANILGAINVNPDTASASTYNANGFPLFAGTTSQLGLPNYASSFGSALMTPSYFVSSPVCLGQPITFAATTTSVIDTAFWQITNNVGSIVYTSQNLSDTTTLATAGDYLVSLLIGNRCGFTVSFSETITVNAPPQASSLPAGLPICGPSALLEVYDVDPPNYNDLTFLWSTGETTEAITVNSLGIYDVVTTDTTSGCTTATSVFVGPPFTVDLGPDQNTCETDPLILDSQANANLYNWFIDNNPVVPANNQRTFDFGAQALPAGVYTVRVEVEDPVDPTCFVVDETLITINAIPQFTADELTPVTACGLTDGVLEINLTSAGNFTYVVSGPTPVLASPATGPGLVQVPGLAAGVYVVTITNNVSACSEQVNDIVITEPIAFNIINVTTVDNGCFAPSGEIIFELDVAAGSIDWLVRDQAGLIVKSSPDDYLNIGDTIRIPGLNDGTYSLEVSGAGAGGCTDSEIGIVVDPTELTDLVVPLTIASCGTTLDLTGYPTSTTPGFVFEWSLDNGTTYNPINTPYVELGNNTVLFKASSGATCDSTQSVDVTLVPTPTVDILVDTTNICNGVVVLTADADGGYPGAPLTYRWSTGETTQSINVTTSSTINLSVSNNLNQSCFVIESEAVTLPTPFTVTLSSSLACDDGSPFTLTAIATNSFVDYTWFLNGTELPDKTSIIQSITAGVFEVVVTDQGVGKCSNSTMLEVIKAPVTPTDLSSAVVFCFGEDPSFLTLDAGSDFISYLWLPGGETTQTIDVFAEGEYSVSATNNFNCVTDDQSQVFEDCIPKVYGPTAFRPGGLNAEFYLFTDYVEDFEIFIYNRWGTLVFQSTDINFRWDGIFEGELLPADQYTYVVRYTSSFRDRGTLEQYGGVVLVR